MWTLDLSIAEFLAKKCNAPLFKRLESLTLDVTGPYGHLQDLFFSPTLRHIELTFDHVHTEETWLPMVVETALRSITSNVPLLTSLTISLHSDFYPPTYLHSITSLTDPFFAAFLHWKACTA